MFSFSGLASSMFSVQNMAQRMQQRRDDDRSQRQDLRQQRENERRRRTRTYELTWQDVRNSNVDVAFPGFLEWYLRNPWLITPNAQPIRTTAGGTATTYRVTVHFQKDHHGREVIPTHVHTINLGNRRKWLQGTVQLYQKVVYTDGNNQPQRTALGDMAYANLKPNETDIENYIWVQEYINVKIVVEDITPVRGGLGVPYIPFRDGQASCFLQPFIGIHAALVKKVDAHLEKQKVKEHQKGGNNKPINIVKGAIELDRNKIDHWKRLLHMSTQAIEALEKIELEMSDNGVHPDALDLIQRVGLAARTKCIKLYTPDNFEVAKRTYTIDTSSLKGYNSKWLVPEVRLVVTRAGHVETMDYLGATINDSCMVTHDVHLAEHTLNYDEFCATLKEIVEAQSKDLNTTNSVWIKASGSNEPLWFWYKGVRFTCVTKRVTFMKDVMKRVRYAVATEGMYNSYLVSALAEGCLVAGIALFPALRNLFNDKTSARVVVVDPSKVRQVAGLCVAFQEVLPEEMFIIPEELQRLVAEGALYRLGANYTYEIPEGYVVKDVDKEKAYLNWSMGLPDNLICRAWHTPGLFQEAFTPTPEQVAEMLDTTISKCEGYALVRNVDFTTIRCTPAYRQLVKALYGGDDLVFVEDDAWHSNLFKTMYAVDAEGTPPNVISFIDLRLWKHCNVTFTVDFVWLSYDLLEFDMRAFKHATDATEENGKPCYVLGPGMLMGMNAFETFLIPGTEEDAQQFCALANEDTQERAARVRRLAALDPSALGPLTEAQEVKLHKRNTLVYMVGEHYVELQTPKKGGLRTYAHVAGYVTRGVGVQLLLAMAGVPKDHLLQAQLDGFHRLWPVDVPEECMRMPEGFRIKKKKTKDADGNEIQEDRKPCITSLRNCALARLVPTQSEQLPDVADVPKHRRAPFLKGFAGAATLLLGDAGAGKSHAVADAIREGQIFNVLTLAPAHDLCHEHAHGGKKFPMVMTHAMLSEDRREMSGGSPRDDLLVQYGLEQGRNVLRYPPAWLFVDEANFLGQRQKLVIQKRLPHTAVIYAADLHPVTLAPRQLGGGEFGGAMNDDGVAHHHHFTEVHRTSQPELKALWKELYALNDAARPVARVLESMLRFFLNPDHGLMEHIVSTSMVKKMYDANRDHVCTPTRRCPVCGQPQLEDCRCHQGAHRDDLNFATKEKAMEFDRKFPEGVLPYEPNMSQAHVWAFVLRNHAPPLKIRDPERTRKICEGFIDPDAMGEGDTVVVPPLVRGGRYVPRSQAESDALIAAKACYNAACTSVHSKQGSTIEMHERFFMVMDKTWDGNQILVQATRVRQKESMYIVVSDDIHYELQGYVDEREALGFLMASIKLSRFATESEVHKLGKRRYALDVQESLRMRMRNVLVGTVVVREEYTLPGEVMPWNVEDANRRTEEKNAKGLSTSACVPYPTFKTADVAVVARNLVTGQHTKVLWVAEIVYTNPPDDHKKAYYEKKKVPWVEIKINSEGSVIEKTRHGTWPDQDDGDIWTDAYRWW